MAYALVANVAAGATDGGNNVTTGGVDTSGADLLIVAVASYDGGGVIPTITVSDSKSNTWTPLTRTGAGDVVLCRFYYCVGGTVGGSHTFTASSTGGFPTVLAAAFSGAHASPFDQETAGAHGSGITSIQPGSVTPGEDNELLVSVVGLNAANTISINGGFTESDEVAYSSGNHFGASLAYLIQTSAAAANPTWSWASSTAGATTIATFKAAAAAGGFIAFPRPRGARAGMSALAGGM